MDGAKIPFVDQKRRAINEWIRTSGAFDGVIDFDAITRDPDHPDRFLPAYDSGDHLHPGDAGYQAMGAAIDLALFRRRGAP
jgi:lysophospholipase L1-like esterase